MKSGFSENIESQRFEPSSPLLNDVVTEDSAAELFVQKYGEDIRFCHSTGAWFIWNGVRWRRDQVGTVFDKARRLARELGQDQDERGRKVIGKTSFAGGMERFARTDQSVSVIIDNWDCDPWQLGTPGGTVDLTTGKLGPPSRSDGITKSTLCAPLEEGCPRWLQFLDETTGSDQRLVRFLQQWCGYAVTGLTREHALVFVYGPGGNGKSVFLNVVTAILAEYAATSAMDTFTAGHGDKHPTDLAMLRGARLVTASETEEGRPWAEARIKQLTGGDRIAARFMRQDFFEFTPQFKLMIVGNHKPSLQNVDDAARRRFNIVPFVLNPTAPDRELETKLMMEAGGILRWIIDGCLDWQGNGLLRPESVMVATEEYFKDQDLFSQWLAETCDLDPGNRYKEANATALFSSWKAYALAAGEDPKSQKVFKPELLKRGISSKHTKFGNAFIGIRLNPVTPFPDHEG
jgi:putative DNA primase/helicase